MQHRDSNDRIHGDPRNPDPSDTPGLEEGGGVQPGDTPPVADTMSESAEVPVEKEKAPAAGNKVALAVILGIAVLMVIGFVAMAATRVSL